MSHVIVMQYAWCLEYCDEFPIHTHTRIFKQMDTSGDQRLDYNEFVETLKKMDRNLKSLPATAQVASQQVISLPCCNTYIDLHGQLVCPVNWRA